jgi:hypothetical protein
MAYLGLYLNLAGTAQRGFNLVLQGFNFGANGVVMLL